MTPFTDDHLGMLYRVFYALSKKCKAVQQNELASSIEVHPQAVYNFLRDDRQPRPNNSEMLYRLLDHLREREHVYRAALRAALRGEDLEQCLSDVDHLLAPTPGSPLNHLFEYFVHVRAIDPGRSKEFSSAFCGSYRLYRPCDRETMFCSTLRIFDYSARQKTPYFENCLVDANDNLRVVRGNVLQLDLDLVFLALVEKAQPISALQPRPRRTPKKDPMQTSAWVGVKTMVFPNPGKAPLDRQFGVCFSRSAAEHEYELGNVLILRDVPPREFRLKAPGIYPAEEALAEIKTVANIDAQQFKIAVGEHEYLGSIRLRIPNF